MSDTSVLFDRAALIGVGLIGSSLARCMKRHGLVGHIAATALTQSELDTAQRLGFVDSVSLSLPETVSGADLVMVCTPIGAFAAVGEAIAPALKPGAIVSDVGSTKQSVIRDLGPLVPEGVHFVPGHPIAGTEHSGPEAGFAELFEGRWCILTPPPGTDPAAIDRIAELWRRCGASIEIMDPAHHDQVLAITSHLPHLIAFTIVGTATDLGTHLQQEVIKFAASGFRDFTRIAASDPIMWRDIFLNNRDSLLDVCARLQEDLAQLQRAIRWGEGEKIESLIRRTREIRRRLIDAKQA